MSRGQALAKDYSKYGFSMPDKSVFKTPKGLSEETVRTISRIKSEPEWMLDIRLRAYKAFLEKPMPSWGPDLSDIDFGEITYYVRPSEKKAKTWKELPEEIKKTFDRLGIPEAERNFLAGVGAQYDSEVIYHQTRKELEKKGVVFLDMDTALKKHPEIVKKHFSTIVPLNDNKFAALNTAVWSGGSFVYVPKGVRVEISP